MSQDRDAIAVSYLESKAPDLVDEHREHRKGQRERPKIRELPVWMPT